MADLSTIKTITDWRIRDADLPELSPGETYERLITPQKFVALLRIIVRDVVLVSVRIGAVENVPFELESTDGSTRTYKPTGLDRDDLKNLLVMTGAAIASSDSIAMVPGLDVRSIVKNEGTTATKFCVALVVQEEPA